MSRSYNKTVKATLRQKSVQMGEKQSLYIDFYPSILNPLDGKHTRRFSLGIYLWTNAANKSQRSENKTKLAFAEQRRANIEIGILNNDYSFFGDITTKVHFLDFAKRTSKTASHKTMLAHLEHFLKQAKKTDINICDIDLMICENFRDYLLSMVAQNTASAYFQTFKTFLYKAKKESPIAFDLNDLKNIKMLETNRAFLTISELKLLINMDCNKILLKNACLFSAFTGLRISDIENLTWGNIQKNDKGFVLNFRQQKTKRIETIPIGDFPLSYCGERKADSQKVFEGLNLDKSSQRFDIKLWVASSGIKKNITFHCFRHTYATMLLNEGVDIYTVSKMLGHRDIRTTQIYAKVADDTKRNAAQKIDNAMKDTNTN